jgi:hypothetical protein
MQLLLGTLATCVVLAVVAIGVVAAQLAGARRRLARASAGRRYELIPAGAIPGQRRPVQQRLPGGSPVGR